MHRMNGLMLRAKHTLLILSLVLSICVLWGDVVSASVELSCKYSDSINITGVTVETYDRGFICNIKKCIRLCCPIGCSVDDEGGFCNHDKPKTIDEINQEVQFHKINSNDKYIFEYVVDEFNESMKEGLFYAEDTYQIDDVLATHTFWHI